MHVRLKIIKQLSSGDQVANECNAKPQNRTCLKKLPFS